ncbi:DUF1073 domain-containing protein [Anaerosolibacter sp.]|uniref:phage portal protein n=1 Tax=Anaerosolibacter sp. TaxID=1872527 RepID=UPI0039EE5A16
MIRSDGYMNLVTGFGQKNRDPMANWSFNMGDLLSEQALSNLYMGNRLAKKIVDLPADEAVKNWIDIKKIDTDIVEMVQKELNRLNAEHVLGDGLRWSRLFGGSAIFIVAQDGGLPEDPLDIRSLETVEQIRVYDKTEIFYEDTMLYDDPHDLKYGQPEHYTIQPVGGMPFKVHESRLLLMKGEPLPARYRAIYQDWGMPILQGITEELQNCSISYSSAALVLQRFSQAIYKMPDLSALLETEGGEKQAMDRLHLIDMARTILNTILIDSEEEFELKNITITGIKDLLDQFGILISSISNIPYTLLFGRSPAGMNSTGESDLENYYNMVRQIQKRLLSEPLIKLIKLIFLSQSGPTKGKEPDNWSLEFNPLWLPSDEEKAKTDKMAAEKDKVEAETAKIYVDIGALDPSEVRTGLEDKYYIDKSIDMSGEEEVVEE